MRIPPGTCRPKGGARVRRPGAAALPYVGALDGVRALAVAGVLLYHAGVPWLPGGFLGVDLFFVLSGFLITSLLLAEREATGRIDLARFWLRRARRLLPAAFVVIGVCLLVVAFLPPGEAARTRADALASLGYVNNWHQVLADRSYFESFGRPSLLEHLWSLAVEEQFYLLWPLFLGFALTRLGRRRTALLTLAAATASALAMGLLFEPGSDPSRVYFGTDTHASGLLAGALLAFLWPLGRFRATPHPSAVWVLDAAAVAGLAAVVAAMATVHDYDPFVYRGGIAAFGVAAAVLIGAVSHPACRVARPPGVGAAALDRAAQLRDLPVALARDGADPAGSGRRVAARGCSSGCRSPSTVLLAAASYRWIEMPVRTGAARAWLDRRAPRVRLAIASGGALALALVLSGVFVGARDGGARASAPLTVGAVGRREPGRRRGAAGAVPAARRRRVGDARRARGGRAPRARRRRRSAGRSPTSSRGCTTTGGGTGSRPAWSCRSARTAPCTRATPAGCERRWPARSASSSSTSACGAPGRRRPTRRSPGPCAPGRRRSWSTGTARAAGPACSTTTASIPRRVARRSTPASSPAHCADAPAVRAGRAPARPPAERRPRIPRCR